VPKIADEKSVMAKPWIWAIGSIPTAPTNHLPDGWKLSKFTRGQKGADKANDPVLVR
jgi:hypothetical protein